MPAQVGHVNRIKATPSDLPFKSTGFAIYPVPSQVGQSCGSTPVTFSVKGIVPEAREKFAAECLPLRITNKNSGGPHYMNREIEPVERGRKKKDGRRLDKRTLAYGNAELDSYPPW